MNYGQEKEGHCLTFGNLPHPPPSNSHDRLQLLFLVIFVLKNSNFWKTITWRIGEIKKNPKFKKNPIRFMKMEEEKI